MLGLSTVYQIEERRLVLLLSGNVADITHALQRLTESPHVASLSSAVSKATSRISAIGERGSEEFPIPGRLLQEILKVKIMLPCAAVKTISIPNN